LQPIARAGWSESIREGARAMKPSASGLLGCLIAWPLTCWAQSSTAGGSLACTVDDAQSLQWLARSPGSSPLLPERERFMAEVGASAAHGNLTGSGARLEFRDHLDYVARVRSLRALSVVRLWDSRNMSVFLGVDRRGVYGIHLRREDPHEGALH
jgi:hypothetical protein